MKTPEETGAKVISLEDRRKDKLVDATPAQMVGYLREMIERVEKGEVTGLVVGSTGPKMYWIYAHGALSRLDILWLGEQIAQYARADD